MIYVSDSVRHLFLDNLSRVFSSSSFFFTLSLFFSPSSDAAAVPAVPAVQCSLPLNHKQHYLSACLPSGFQPFTLTRRLPVINPTEWMKGDILDAE